LWFKASSGKKKVQETPHLNKKAGMVVSVCNPSYVGGMKDQSSGQLGQKCDPYLKK
jgi:hypothetical protein